MVKNKKKPQRRKSKKSKVKGAAHEFKKHFQKRPVAEPKPLPKRRKIGGKNYTHLETHKNKEVAQETAVAIREHSHFATRVVDKGEQHGIYIRKKAR